MLSHRNRDSKISQAALMKEFIVAEKKLHLAISGRKYDSGKRFPKQKPEPKKKKAAKMDEPKTDVMTDNIMSDSHLGENIN